MGEEKASKGEHCPAACRDAFSVIRDSTLRISGLTPLASSTSPDQPFRPSPPTEMRSPPGPIRLLPIDGKLPRKQTRNIWLLSSLTPAIPRSETMRGICNGPAGRRRLRGYKRTQMVRWMCTSLQTHYPARIAIGFRPKRMDSLRCSSDSMGRRNPCSIRPGATGYQENTIGKTPRFLTLPGKPLPERWRLAPKSTYAGRLTGHGPLPMSNYRVTRGNCKIPWKFGKPDPPE